MEELLNELQDLKRENVKKSFIELSTELLSKKPTNVKEMRMVRILQFMSDENFDFNINIYIGFMIYLKTGRSLRLVDDVGEK